jgi:hypothetical protein
MPDWPGFRWPHRLPDPARWEEPLKPCRACAIPTGWRTPRGSPVHPACVNRWEQIQPADLEAARACLTNALGPLEELDWPVDPDARWHPIRWRHGPCSWCGRPGTGITEDTYLHCAAHMWPPYRWTEEDERAHQQRSRGATGTTH